MIHYTGMADGPSARARLCDPTAEVSAHWLIHENGLTEPLVPEDRRAWHAGAGSWQGREDVNSRSIGIELVNPGDSPFPEPQMAALERLLAQIMAHPSNLLVLDEPTNDLDVETLDLLQEILGDYDGTVQIGRAHV